MSFRPFDAERDQAAVERIWREVGWIEDNKKHAEGLKLFMTAGSARVAEIDGEAECMVATCPGTVRHLQTDLSMSCVTAVTTSRIARKQGFAGNLTAHAIADDAREGALVASLGMFEQGYYDRLGFGSGSYIVRIMLDPATLRVDPVRKPPKRLTVDDAPAIHRGRLARRLTHGGCNLTPLPITQAEVTWGENPFGLGYYDEAGEELTHHVWFEIREKVSNGPYRVSWMAYQTDEQFLELLGVMKNLGDQVLGIKMNEPAGIQMQDFSSEPFRRWTLADKSRFASDQISFAYWQMRMNDIPGCLEHTHLRGDLRFNLELTDPIEKFLPEDAPWRGVAGSYVVTLGSDSGAERGRDDALPTLTTTVNAFTRLWLGVRPATGLTVSDELAGPRELLEELDWTLRLPTPQTDWDF